MKAIAVIPSQRQLALVDHPEPMIEAATQVKFKILEVGVCGTDKEIADFKYGWTPEQSDYLILGHEALGEVVEVGAAVTQFKVGDLVVPTVRRPCIEPHCSTCQSGQQDYCYTQEYTERGIKQIHGYMTELIVEEEAYLNLLPPSLRDVGILCEPLSIVEKGILELQQFQTRMVWSCDPTQPSNMTCRKALVLGAGPIGLLAAMLFLEAGFETIIYSRSPKPNTKADLTEALGAHYISSETVSITDFAKQMGPVDVVYEATGIPQLAFDLMGLLGSNAVFLFSGVAGDQANIQIDAQALIRNFVLKNQIIFGAVNANPQAFKAAINDLQRFKQRWPDLLPKLISGRYAMTDYASLLQGKPGGIKNIIEISG